LTTDEYRNASPSSAAVSRRYAASQFLLRYPRVAAKIAHLGELADFTLFHTSLGKARAHRTRESLWEAILPELDVADLTVVELGVAWGYATHWWLTRLPGPSLRWHGFDTFEGLPTSFRSLDQGTFTAGGHPPAIADQRLHWHVGLVEETLEELNLASRTGRFLVLFDLDLYAPSLFAWDLIKTHIRPGDVLYFDEAYDSNERRLLVDHVLPGGRWRLLGASTTGLALQAV
jgi:hypothetical protein